MGGWIDGRSRYRTVERKIRLEITGSLVESSWSLFQVRSGRLKLDASRACEMIHDDVYDDREQNEGASAEADFRFTARIISDRIESYLMP